MKLRTLFFGPLVLSMSLSGGLIYAADAPKVGEPLALFTLPIPSDPAARAYLGLPEGEKFSLSQIKAKVVIIEIFSMYCPYCQREAPEVNKLFQKIEGDPALKGPIKLMGIAPGNSPFEVEVFRKKYEVPFPLFSDEKFSIHKLVGEVRTPYFIGVKLNPDGTHQVFLSHLGGLEGHDRFLEQVMGLSGLKRGVAK